MTIDKDGFKVDLIMKMIAACDMSCSQREVQLLTDSECLQLCDLLDEYLDRVTLGRVKAVSPAYLE